MIDLSVFFLMQEVRNEAESLAAPLNEVRSLGPSVLEYLEASSPPAAAETKASLQELYDDYDK